MNYQSTRNNNIKTDSLNAVLAGIAPDGGLFISPEIENLDFNAKSIINLSTQDMAARILSALLPEYGNMDELVKQAYRGKFETEDLTPLVKVGSSYILELFRGPTSAFKDVALSMLPVLITAAKKQKGSKEQTVILTATSGDTGKAALEGFKNVEGTKIIVFYPYGGVSAVQKAQMVTQEGNNVLVCAVKGNFDDCQRGVKKAFGEIKEKLSSANSINIGRLAPQVVYYFAAYRDLLNMKKIKWGDKVDYIVPTGNFGDILAGFYAKLMGLPVGKLICAANMNNVLTDFINTGVYDRNRPFYKTASPSMDILVSSNLERLLFLASGKDTEKVSMWMNQLNTKGTFTVDDKTLSYIKESFGTYCCSEKETEEEIAQCWNENKYLTDPHTAVAWHACKLYKKESGTKNPCVVLSTASPFKFPSAVLKSLGFSTEESEFEQMKKLSKITDIKAPENLVNLENKKERFTDVIDNDKIVDYVMKYLNNRR